MRWCAPALIAGLVVCGGLGCDDDDPLAPAETDPTGEYRVTTTVVSNTCAESFPCDPLCNLWWLGISSESQPLFVGRYGDLLVVCPLGPDDESMIVNGTYADGLFDYRSENDIVVSRPEPGCRMEQRWSSTLAFDANGFSGGARYELRLVEGDPAVCAAASQRYSTLPCATEYELDAVRCTGCTPAVCDPG